MSKTYYPIEEALERIAEETNFTMNKSPYDMTEEELDDAEQVASKFVSWVEDKDYIQAVPVKPDGTKIYPE